MLPVAPVQIFTLLLCIFNLFPLLVISYNSLIVFKNQIRGVYFTARKNALNLDFTSSVCKPVFTADSRAAVVKNRRRRGSE